MAVLLGGLAWGGYRMVGWRVASGAVASVARARRMLTAGSPAAARESLSWLRHFRPDDADALLVTGQCLLAEGDRAGALATLERVPAAERAFREARWSMARALLEDGQLARAEEVLQSFLRQFRDAHEAREELRWLYFNEFRMRDVESLVEEALRNDPADVETLKHQLLTEFRHPVPREGVGFLERVEEQRPGQAAVLRGLGYCYWQLGEQGQAERCLRASLEANPADPETWLTAAEFVLEQRPAETLEKFLAEMNDTLKSHDSIDVTNDDRWWWLTGRLAESRGDLEAALAAVKRARRERPFELRYAHRVALLLQRLGRTEAAAAAFRDVAELEAVQKRLTEIVYGGTLERLTAIDCREIAGLCARRKKPNQAALWREAAERLEKSR